MKLLLLKDFKKIMQLAVAALLLFVFTGITICQAFHHHHSVKKADKHSKVNSYYTAFDQKSCAFCDFVQKQTNGDIAFNEFNSKSVTYFIRSVRVYHDNRTSTDNWLFPPCNSPPMS